MKRKVKKKSFKKILIIVILFLLFISYIRHNFKNEVFEGKISKIITNSEYDVIAKPNNNNYNGIGQEAVKNKDGYFTIFTTFEKSKKIYKEYKQNGNAPWSNKEYWGGTMTENGCRNNYNGNYFEWLW